MANTLLLQKIARRYAKAWLEAGSDNQQTKSDIENLKGLIEKNPGIITFFENPLISIEEKQQLIQDKFAPALSKTSGNILKLMAESNRLNTLAYVISAYEELQHQQDGIAQAQLIVPTAIPDKLIEKLKTQIKKHYAYNEVNVEVIEEPEILAGAILKINGQQIDGSYRSKLKQLQVTQ